MSTVLDEVFKHYDVRGLYPMQLNEQVAFFLAQAFASFLRCRTVAVGRDCRIGSEELFKGFSEGLVEQGCTVIDLGLISTDMLYFAVGQYGFDAGCMVTASHLPKEFAGFKFCGKGAAGISKDNGLWSVRDLAAGGEFKQAKRKGKIFKKEVLSDYIQKCLFLIDVKKIKNLQIVIDASNGMAAKTINAIEKRLPIKITKLFFELDGAFPNHEPNPLDPKALLALQQKVALLKADCGAIFDGDGDRMFLVDEKGQTVNGSMLTCLIASNFLRRWPGSKILYTPVMSKIVLETIKASGGTPVLERVGHTFIKTRMRKEKAVFGGELSGHFYFRDNFFADSGLIALLVALEALSLSGKKLSELIAPFRRYYAIDETNSDVLDKDAKMAEIERIYATKAKSTSKLDGFSAYFDDWWFNVRASGTENLLRLNLEADSRELMLRKKEELLKIIRG